MIYGYDGDKMIKNIIDLFENNVVKNNALKTAVIDRDEQYSFAFIKEHAKKIASYILSYPVQSDRSRKIYSLTSYIQPSYRVQSYRGWYRICMKIYFTNGWQN